MDGPKESQDALRVFSNGKGSYDIVAPKVKALIARHKSRPIAARVTMTQQVSDVKTIFHHLKHELGFAEVGFAPVTAAPDRLYTIQTKRWTTSWTNSANWRWSIASMRFKARRTVSLTCRTPWRSCMQALISLTLWRGVGPGWRWPQRRHRPCHRFVDSDAHALGNVLEGGMDKAKQKEFLAKGHIGAKYDCHTCWARPLCAGGCHHEAFVRYGDTSHPNLHFCDWIRDWTDICLQIYGDIAVHNPAFLDAFENERQWHETSDRHQQEGSPH